MKIEYEYICPICGQHCLDREEALECLASHSGEIRVERVYRCSKCYARFPDSQSAANHESFCHDGIPSYCIPRF